VNQKREKGKPQECFSITASARGGLTKVVKKCQTEYYDAVTSSRIVEGRGESSQNSRMQHQECHEITGRGNAKTRPQSKDHAEKVHQETHEKVLVPGLVSMKTPLNDCMKKR